MFLGNFSASILESSVDTFVIIESLSKLWLFQNMESHHTPEIFKGKAPFTSHKLLLTPALFYCVTSFKYDGKKARVVGLACKCYLSRIMTASILKAWVRNKLFVVVAVLFLLLWFIYLCCFDFFMGGASFFLGVKDM